MTARKNRIDTAEASSAKPEILEATPRRGGYVPREAADEDRKPAPCVCASATSSSAVESLYRKSDPSACEDERISLASLLEADSPDDVATMLAITVSCVMLMASEFPDIPDQCLAYTENYLECIKDENDKHPPNIEGILGHIRRLQEARKRASVAEPAASPSVGSGRSAGSRRGSKKERSRGYLSPVPSAGRCR